MGGIVPDIGIFYIGEGDQIGIQDIGLAVAAEAKEPA